MDTSSIAAILTSISGVIVTLLTVAGKWVNTQLAECKASHKESLIQIEKLNVELRTVSTIVGRLEGELLVRREHDTDDEIKQL